ncbi:hypothetical protein RRG08_048582 [Elysia crispata]|uniref:Uncharacterized protein n=1 Tax=Elysia crispata TaxID=231223 RepID=A0AAE1E9Z0_9GAST|nr:hypothetical protein RRG08_048582 [Elysia crispata]
MKTKAAQQNYAVLRLQTAVYSDGPSYGLTGLELGALAAGLPTAHSFHFKVMKNKEKIQDPSRSEGGRTGLAVLNSRSMSKEEIWDYQEYWSDLFGRMTALSETRL